MQTGSKYTSVRISDLKVSYSDSFALEVPQAEFSGNVIAVLGHNGAGKSTLIKTILGLLPRISGEIEMRYHSSGSSLLLKPEEHMAFCPETGSVFADISVESYVKLWCRLKHGNANYYKKEGSSFVDLLSLAPLFPKLGRELSKGQRRRVQTAIGFLTKPKFFLFDEPFDGLDVQKTNELTDIIQAQAENMSFVVSSHRMDVVERLADVVVVLREGKIASSGSLEQVCKDLCKQSMLISNASDLEQLVSHIRLRFPDVVVNRIGQQISVTGAECSPQDLWNVVREIDQNGVQCEETRPCLVDAMNYHLRKVG